MDAYARWPGVIETGSKAADIIHVSDLFTTFARVAQAEEYIPRDRVIDGVDQTALLLNGEHHGRRDYVYVYQNELLRAVVKQEWKMHLPAPGMLAPNSKQRGLNTPAQRCKGKKGKAPPQTQNPHRWNATWQ